LVQQSNYKIIRNRLSFDNRGASLVSFSFLSIALLRKGNKREDRIGTVKDPS
jgi:putative NADH-flavin reductase